MLTFSSKLSLGNFIYVCDVLTRPYLSHRLYGLENNSAKLLSENPFVSSIFVNSSYSNINLVLHMLKEFTYYNLTKIYICNVDIFFHSILEFLNVCDVMTRPYNLSHKLYGFVKFNYGITTET